MSVIDEIHVNDDGTVLEFTVKDKGAIKDCSTALEMKLLIEKPDKTTIVRNLVFTTTGEDGKVQYITDELDFDTHGHWRFQLKITFPNGIWRSNIITRYISDNLIEPGD